MAVAKEQIRQIISENNINSVADIYTLLKDSFKDSHAYRFCYSGSLPSYIMLSSP